MITKYPGYDPEVSNGFNAITQGLEMGVIPNAKTYTIGLRLGSKKDRFHDILNRAL